MKYEKQKTTSFFVRQFEKEKGKRNSFFVRKFENEKRKDGIYTDRFLTIADTLKGGCQVICAEFAEQKVVTASLLSRTWESSTPKRIAVSSARLGIISNQSWFETRCFVYH